jgi:hypothetical protein
MMRRLIDALRATWPVIAVLVVLDAIVIVWGVIWG